MNEYYSIIKLLLNKTLYNKYKDYLPQNHIKENYPETYRIIKSLESLHTGVYDVYSVDDLELSFYTNYPNSNKDSYKPLFEFIRNSEAKPEFITGYLDGLRRRAIATDLARASLKYAEGTNDDDTTLERTIQDLSSKLYSGDADEISSRTDEDFVTDDLEKLYNDKILTKGLRWRLESLNKSLGSLRNGDFGFIFARPETGKTTFLASEVTHMATQCERPIIWFNNEEQSGKVMIRCIQAVLGLRLEQLHSDIKSNSEKYHSIMKGRLRIYDGPAMTKREVEDICEKHNPSMMVFDQIDKIKGTEAERYDLQMKAIYQWARELSKKYGPVIGVCQAGGTGDGKKWLTMNDVDSSHTAKQGEADFMIGIGKTYDNGLEEVRYMHLCKNKLEGDIDTDPAMRHGKFEVRIQPEIARYSDF